MPGTFLASPLNLVRARLSTGDDKAPMIDKELLQNAEAVVDSMKDHFLDWAEEQVDRLDATVSAASHPGDDWDQRIRRVWRESFELAGLAGTFGYTLMTAIADSLNKTATDRTTLTPQAVQIQKVHMDALKHVIGHRLVGDGGKSGRRLLADLSKAVSKVVESETT